MMMGVGVGGKFVPPTTNVCKRGNSTNFKALFSVVSTDFPELFRAKKYREKVC